MEPMLDQETITQQQSLLGQHRLGRSNAVAVTRQYVGTTICYNVPRKC